MRLALFALFHAAFFGVTVLVIPARGQAAAPAGTVSEIPLPGGLRQAMAIVGDNAKPDRAQFLIEFIRRMYDTPFGPKADVREPIIHALAGQLKSAHETGETVPLPLSTKFWTDVVFRKQATPNTLVASIVESRNAALLYYGLLSLDDDTRSWMGEQPSLISEIVARRAASLVTVAPTLRVSKGIVQVPGGSAAEPVWQALVGRRPGEASDFVRSLLSSDEGRLAFFFGTISQVTPAQLRVALSLDATDVKQRVDAGRRLYSLFERLWVGRALEQRVFVRPSLDPALLISELNPNGDGRITLPGTRGFWAAVFNEVHQTAAQQEAPQAITWDQPPDFAWLAEQVFKGDISQHRRHFMMVLFASRHAAGITRETARDALDAIRAAGSYPALTAALERTGISDLTIFAVAARRAAALNAIADDNRAFRGLAQYQGALALITRAATRGSITVESATQLVSSLSAIPLSERGEYEGRVVAWLPGFLGSDVRAARKNSTSGPAADGTAEEIYESAAGPVEEDALRILTGPQPSVPRMLDWEGTRYRVDFPRAEALRLTQSQGGAPGTHLSSARAVLSIADVLAGSGLTRELVQQQAEALAQVPQAEARAENEEYSFDLRVEQRDALNALQRMAKSGDVNGASRLAGALRTLADGLVARGLMEWTYAAALGPRDGISIAASDAASRHQFGLRPAANNRAAVWRLPIAGTDATQRWRVHGSLLGLDVALSDFSLVRLSTKPPARRPSLGEVDRRVFIETLALIEPRSLTDSGQDTIASAIGAGRARLATIHSPADVPAIAQALDMSSQRQTLLSWTVSHDPTRVSVSLSPIELFWLGLGESRVTKIDAWGTPAGARTGCQCLQVVREGRWDVIAGRWNTGMLASTFPDLNFRIAELLNELHMPASLLAPVLAAATLDFVNSANSRDQDDRRGLVEFVQDLRVDRVEQYLALLTTDGPLVPVGDARPGKGSAGNNTDRTHMMVTR